MILFVNFISQTPIFVNRLFGDAQTRKVGESTTRLVRHVFLKKKLLSLLLGGVFPQKAQIMDVKNHLKKNI